MECYFFSRSLPLDPRVFFRRQAIFGGVRTFPPEHAFPPVFFVPGVGFKVFSTRFSWEVTYGVASPIQDVSGTCGL